jgi:hypothetical protein
MPIPHVVAIDCGTTEWCVAILLAPILVAPSQGSSAPGNIGLAHLWIVFGAQIFTDNPCRIPRQFIDDLRKFFDRPLLRIANIDRLSEITLEQTVDSFNQIIDILE